MIHTPRSDWSYRRAVRTSKSKNLLRLFIQGSLAALILMGVMIAPPSQRAQNPPCDTQPGCRAPVKFDIAFMLDRSGSLASRGQTWNIMVEGLLRTIRDSTVIPRDGSVAVTVVAFDGAATIVAPLTDIASAADVSKVETPVQALRCGNIKSQIFPCPAGETSWFAAILSAYNHINQTRQINPKPGARRVLVLVSDGETTPGDLADATQLAEQDRASAATLGIPLVFNAFMLGVSPQSAEFTDNKAALDQIVTPQGATGTPGVTTVINPGACNLDG